MQSVRYLNEADLMADFSCRSVPSADIANIDLAQSTKGADPPYFLASLLKMLVQPNTSTFNVIRFFPKSLRKQELR